MLRNDRLGISCIVWCLQVNNHISDALPLLHHPFKLLLFVHSILDPVLLFDALEYFELIQAIYRKVGVVYIVFADRSSIHFVTHWILLEPLIQSGLGVIILLVVQRLHLVAKLRRLKSLVQVLHILELLG